MSVTGEFWRYSSDRLIPQEFQLPEKLTVADSFLVQNGAVRALGRHLERFSSSITDDPVTQSQLPDFFEAALGTIPEEGVWWPRFEYRNQIAVGDRLALQLRAAPELSETVTLWSYDQPDPRQNPLVKGPDLALGQQLRRAANMHGADETVLLDSDGFIADGALSSIMWWRDGVLFGPNSETNWLPSVTREEVKELALQAGFEVADEKVRPADLEGLEVWCLSAVQGIRGVTSWIGIEVQSPKLYQSFRKRLSLTFSRISQREYFEK